MEFLKKYTIISPGLFILVVISFFMSFFTVKCSSVDLLTIEGKDLVFGKEYTINSSSFSVDKEHKTEKSEPNVWAIIPFTLAIAGIGIWFTRMKRKHLILMIFAIVSFISLFVLKSTITKDIDKEEVTAIITIVPKAGYNIAVFSNLVLAVIEGLLMYNKRPENIAVSEDDTASQETP